jgi:hypothetical protein
MTGLILAVILTAVLAGAAGWCIGYRMRPFTRPGPDHRSQP